MNDLLIHNVEENPETVAKFKNACYGTLDIMKKRLGEIGK